MTQKTKAIKTPNKRYCDIEILDSLIINGKVSELNSLSMEAMSIEFTSFSPFNSEI